MSEQDWKCGPLTAAILQRDATRVRRLLERGQSTNEKTDTGLTPLHVAVTWPTGIRLLIQHGADIGAEDRSGLHAIHYSISLDQMESAAELLRADCALYFDPDRDEQWIMQLLVEASPEMQTLIINEMCTRRLRLIQFVATSITENEVQMSTELPRASQSIPDMCLKRWTALLDRHGISLPASLNIITEPPTVFHYRTGSGSFLPLAGKRMSLVQKFFDAGFKDLDEYDMYGFTPLLEACYISDYTMALWILNRMAVKRTHRDFWLTPLHFLAVSVRKQIGNESVFKKLLSTLLRGGLSIKDGDRCGCPCSAIGCTFTTLLCRSHTAGLGSRDTHQIWEGGHLEDVFDITSSLLAEDDSLLQELYSQRARLEAFEHLGLTHICCHFSSIGVGRLSRQDARATRLLEADLIGELKTIVADYDIKRKKSVASARAFFMSWIANFPRSRFPYIGI